MKFYSVYSGSVTSTSASATFPEDVLRSGTDVYLFVMFRSQISEINGVSPSAGGWTLVRETTNAQALPGTSQRMAVYKRAWDGSSRTYQVRQTGSRVMALIAVAVPYASTVSTSQAFADPDPRPTDVRYNIPQVSAPATSDAVVFSFVSQSIMVAKDGSIATTPYESNFYGPGAASGYIGATTQQEDSRLQLFSRFLPAGASVPANRSIVAPYRFGLDMAGGNRGVAMITLVIVPAITALQIYSAKTTFVTYPEMPTVAEEPPAPPGPNDPARVRVSMAELAAVITADWRGNLISDKTLEARPTFRISEISPYVDMGNGKFTVRIFDAGKYEMLTLRKDMSQEFKEVFLDEGINILDIPPDFNQLALFMAPLSPVLRRSIFSGMIARVVPADQLDLADWTTYGVVEYPLLKTGQQGRQLDFYSYIKDDDKGATIYRDGVAIGSIDEPSGVGRINRDIPPSQPFVTNVSMPIEFSMRGKNPESITYEEFMGKDQTFLVQDASGEVEIFTAQEVESIGGSRFRAKNIIRGLYGTDRVSLYGLAAPMTILLMTSLTLPYTYQEEDTGHRVDFIIAPQQYGPNDIEHTREISVVPRHRALIPYAPLFRRNPREIRSGPDILIEWVRRDRSPDADEWDSPAPNLEMSEEFAIDIFPQHQVESIRSRIVTGTSYLYTAQMQEEDFGGVVPRKSGLRVRIAQISSTVGAGMYTEEILEV